MASANRFGNPAWLRVRRVLLAVLALLMLIQIGLGIVWMARNFDTIPGFGDTTEYIELSKTFALDEYRPILYPLILRVARKLSGTSFHRYVYVFQTTLSLLCMCHAVYTLDRVRRGDFGVKPTRGRVALWLFGGLWLTTVPMIACFNLTLLTDSIATSLLVLFLSVGVQVIYAGRFSVGQGVLLLMSLVGQCLIRADRLYSSLLVLGILTVMALIRNPRGRRALLIGAACVAALTLAVVNVVGSATQVRGRNGRVQTTLDFVLLDRVVWPHMVENYRYFPREIQQNITLAEAQTFDSHNNNVMYQMAPLLEARVGRAAAGQYYRAMAEIVWKHSAGAILSDIGESAGFIMVTPLLHYMSVNGLYSKSNIAWNMYCLSQSTPELTKLYDRWGFCLLTAALAVSLVIFIGNRVGGVRRARPFLLWPYIIEDVVLCLWFTLGDGAPPNDRYMLIHYATYALLPLLPFINAGAQAGASGESMNGREIARGRQTDE